MGAQTNHPDETESDMSDRTNELLDLVGGVEALAARCPILATIYLGGCAKITDEGVKALKNAHPNTTVQC